MRFFVAIAVSIFLFPFCAWSEGVSEKSAKMKLACTFEELKRNSSDEGAKEAGKFYNRNGFQKYLIFTYNGNGKPVDVADKSIFRKGSFAHVNREDLVVEFKNPQITGITNRGANFTLVISRFSLEAVLILSMKDKEGKGPFGYWEKRGQCYTERIKG